MLYRPRLIIPIMRLNRTLPKFSLIRLIFRHCNLLQVLGTNVQNHQISILYRVAILQKLHSKKTSLKQGSQGQEMSQDKIQQ